MGKYYNGKLKSIEETKSLHFSLHSNYSCLHVRVTDAVLCPLPTDSSKFLTSSIALRDAPQRVHLVGQRVFRVGESISYTWKSHSICPRNSACFLWNSVSH